MDHWSDSIAKLNPCKDALAWLCTQPDAETAWRVCERGDWMLWIAGRLSGEPGSDSRRPLVLAACGCARLALPYVGVEEDRPRIAIETAEAWARGEVGVTLDRVRAAADAAYATAYVAADVAYATATAAFAAAYAAYAAAAYDAYAAAYAADAYAAIRKKTLSECADIVRTFYPHPPNI